MHIPAAVFLRAAQEFFGERRFIRHGLRCFVKLAVTGQASGAQVP